MTFKDLVKAKLKEKKLTQEDLARAVGVNSVTVSRWINGAFSPSAEKVEAIAKFLDCDKSELNALLLQREQAREIVEPLRGSPYAMAAFCRLMVSMMTEEEQKAAIEDLKELLKEHGTSDSDND